VQSGTPTPVVKLPIGEDTSFVPSVKIGQTITFGGYIWKVLDVQGSMALVITEDIIELRPYNAVYDFVTWETCTLRYYLNNDFYNTFSEKERDMIIETVVYNPDNLWYGTPGGNDTVDRVFLLSLEEVDKYFGNSGDYLNTRGLPDKSDPPWWFTNQYDSAREAKYNGSLDRWWLRSQGRYNSHASFVDDEGEVRVSAFSEAAFVDFRYTGVRPAMWLDLRRGY
jgi:hypothetical protein